MPGVASAERPIRPVEAAAPERSRAAEPGPGRAAAVPARSPALHLSRIAR